MAPNSSVLQLQAQLDARQPDLRQTQAAAAGAVRPEPLIDRSPARPWGPARAPAAGAERAKALASQPAPGRSFAPPSRSASDRAALSGRQVDGYFETDLRRRPAAGISVTRLRRASPAEATRATRAEIDLARLRHNHNELRACLLSGAQAEADAARALQRPQLWPVLKADAYGHGARSVAMTLQQAGVDGLCVALLEEGVELRNAGVRCPILVMGGHFDRLRDGIETLVEHSLTPVVHQVEQIPAIAKVVRYLDRRSPLPVHLEVDTGMGRLGITDQDLEGLVRALRSSQEAVELQGLMTQLACAEAGSLDEITGQLQRLAATDRYLRRAGFRPRLLHAAGSAALLRLPSCHLSLVRPGLALFGIHPCPTAEPPDSLRRPNLKPVMRVLSEIVALRDVPAGAAVGSGHTWRAARPSRLATVPLGYADGLLRGLSNQGHMLVAGRRVPVVGTVSMDLTMLDVTDVPGVALRDEVVILGHQRGRLGRSTITAAELAATSATVPQEVLTSISRRVPRFYRHA